jgi:hypothetical protein
MNWMVQPRIEHQGTSLDPTVGGNSGSDHFDGGGFETVEHADL